MVATDQMLPSINQYNNVETDEDGGVTLYFGPELRDGVPASNFIKTDPERAFLFAIRYYGAEVSFYDQTYKPDDLVKL